MRKSISLLMALALVGGASAQTSTTPKKSATTQSTTKKAGTTSKSGPAATAKKATHPKVATPAVSEPTAFFDTTMGKLTCKLFPDKAPKAVANFAGLANGTKDWRDPISGKSMKGTPLYSGTVFHRVIPGFMIQGGDPTGTGRGNPGYQFEDELHQDLVFDRPGRLAMANSGLNTNGSQFFITEVPTPHLNPCFDEAGCQRPQGHWVKGSGHTIFGQCDEASVALVKQIAQSGNGTVKINSITIAGMGKAGTATPANKATTPGKTTPKTTPKKTTSGTTIKK